MCHFGCPSRPLMSAHVRSCPTDMRILSAVSSHVPPCQTSDRTVNPLVGSSSLPPGAGQKGCGGTPTDRVCHQSAVPLCHDGWMPECRYCGATENLTIEHLIPQARGGTHARSNLGISCAPCNALKGLLTDEEFLSIPRDEKFRAWCQGLNHQVRWERTYGLSTPVPCPPGPRNKPERCHRCRRGEHEACRRTVCVCVDCWTEAA